MARELTTAEKIRKLPWTVAHAATNNVFCLLTLFGSVFILFLDRLNLDKTRIGFLLSLIPFCQVLALFVAPFVMRTGLKRTFIIFFSIRKIVVAFLLLTPIMVAHFGLHGTFIYVSAVILIFAVCRAIGETGIYPWMQEAIPNSVRGKFGAINGIVATLAGVITIAVASFVITHSEGLAGFMALIAAGVVFGFISVVCSFFIPGGSSEYNRDAQPKPFSHVMTPLRDKNFLAYLGGMGLVMLSVAFFAFIPLFMKESVGLASGKVILLQASSMTAGLFSGYLWGWAADRFGSKPVMLSGLYGLVLLPACWFLIPRESLWSLPAAMGIYFFWGAAQGGYATGDMRLLYVSVVPPEKKTAYMSVYYAFIGLVAGAGPLIAGKTLDLFKNIHGSFSIFSFDAYSPIFAASFALMIAGLLILKRVREERAMPAREFVGMFLRGNPLQAFTSLVGYSLARGESARVSMTKRLGDAKSPLNVDELLDALNDPSFNVRHEAIISIAQTRPNRRLTEALIEVLRTGEVDLRTGAAWALGRIGDKRAIKVLRETLQSEYPLLQARSARALGMLGDTESILLLLERLRNVEDEDLRLAYGAALGALRAAEAAPDMLKTLRGLTNPAARSELALSLARIIGGESSFIRLWRQMGSEKGTAIARFLTSLQKKMRRKCPRSRELLMLAAQCEDAFARSDLERGALLLKDMIAAFPLEEFENLSKLILNECAGRIEEFGAERIEYIALALQAIDTAFNKRRGN